MARCLILDANLLKNLWPHAINYSQYFCNRSYQQRTKQPAYELFTKLKPDMQNIFAFGSKCHYLDESPHSKLSSWHKQNKPQLLRSKQR